MKTETLCARCRCLPVVIVVVFLWCALQAQDTVSLGNRHALVVVALSATEGYDQTCLVWVRLLTDHLIEELGFDPRQVTLAGGDTESLQTPGIQRIEPTKEGLVGGLQAIAATLGEESEFYMFVLGSGSYDERDYKLNLRGPDMTGSEIQELLGSIKSSRQAILWGTSSSGEMIPLLSAPGRVIITATRSGRERHDPRFPGFFLESLVDLEADTDKNLRVSWLEAYLAARAKTEDSFKKDGHVATEHALLDDSGDGDGHPVPSEENGEGFLAAATYLGVDKRTGALALANPELLELIKKRDALEKAIQELRSKRADTPVAEYNEKLEQLLVEMARVSAEIRKMESASTPTVPPRPDIPK